MGPVRAPVADTRTAGSALRSRPCCAACRHFVEAASELEARLPGLNTLSSAYAAVRADDGLCSLHDRYVAGSGCCAAWESPEAG